jgi:hypothetical protein
MSIFVAMGSVLPDAQIIMTAELNVIIFKKTDRYMFANQDANG